MFDDIILFIKVVEYRSLSQTAKALNIPAATVSRRLQKLEDALGFRLLHRSARKFHLTGEGESYYRAYQHLAHQFEETERHLSGAMHQLAGPLKVLAPTNISTGILAPMWSAFVQKHPDIQLDLKLNNQMEDIVASQSDIALRIGPQNDSSLYQKKLGEVVTIFIASPDYLKDHGQPQNLEDLNTHRIVQSSLLSSWSLHQPTKGTKTKLFLPASTLVNDVSLARQFVVDGLGITLLPISEVYQELQSGRLIHILPTWQGPQREIYAIWPSGRLLNAKAKELRSFMSEYIASLPILRGKIHDPKL